MNRLILKPKFNLHLPFLWELPTIDCSEMPEKSKPSILTGCFHPARLTMKGVLSHTREETFVMIRAGCIVFYIYISIYELAFGYMLVFSFYFLFFALKSKEEKKKRKKSNHALKPITCCTFDVIFYLSKNYLTRSPSWDEHISFSRVSWPTSRHQVNTSLQFQCSGTNWAVGAAC